MRINKFLAAATPLSRRSADTAIAEGRVLINNQPATQGSQVGENDVVLLDAKPVFIDAKTITLLFNKPVGYVVSRDGQGSKTIFDILPAEFQNLNAVGRLDKNSSGLLLLTNDGELANQLTHPRYSKVKKYNIRLDVPLVPLHHQMIQDRGITLDDGLSKFQIDRQDDDGYMWTVTMNEGKNRQIRRTFTALGYTVRRLHRFQFGQYQLGDLAKGQTKLVK